MEKEIKNNKEILISNAGRRNFLKRLWGALGIIAGLEFLYLGSGFLRAGEKRPGKRPSGMVTAGMIADFNRGSIFPFRNGQFYLIRFDNGGFMAVSLKCTHLGCSVLWDESKKIFNCPCHASSFDQYGEVISPPAPRALDIFPVSFEKGKVLVDINSPLKRKGFDNNQLAFA